MALRKTDYQARKDIVLGIAVREYIKTINPVSSNYIAKQYLPDLSSATIRNILAELEGDGFLTHPHTSAGRVPTQSGYRYYVDNLMHEIQLLENEKETIKAEYEEEVKDLEKLMEKTSQVISDVTQYTSIICVDGWNDRMFCKGTGYVVSYPDYSDLNKIRAILSALEEKQRLLDVINQDIHQKTRIYIGHEIACSNIESCSLAVSSYSTNEGISGRIAILGPTRMDYQKVVSTLRYVSGLMNEVIL